MASKDSHSSYVDGIKVKISEQYKPPPRIILQVSYPQRLTMNDNIRKCMPQYDFNGERSIKSSIAEWKMARKLKHEERENAFDVCRKNIKAIDDNIALQKEKLKQKHDEELEKKVTTIAANDYNITLPLQTVQNAHNILIPTIAGINPQQAHNSLLDKSPFNVSDFDPDTSSPFDNMALKSINDLEELALVLNKDDGVSAKSQQSNQQLNQQTSYQMYNYNDQNAIHSSYSPRNGYYQHDIRTLSQPVNVNHSYSYPPGTYDHQHQHFTAAMPTSQSSVADHRSTPPQQSSLAIQQPHRTVPLIMRNIQQQLDNTHLHHQLSSSPSSRSGLSIGAGSSQLLGVQRPEQLGNPFGSLEVEAQAMCRCISSMGFPLARVARACDLIGNDDKKIVEYLLVMSDLMDLGFSETSVSTALVKCNNDKDKALEELLIS